MDSFSLSDTQLGKVNLREYLSRGLKRWLENNIKYQNVCVPVRANQQASLRQRHSQVQTGSEELLQADQGPVAPHAIRI